MKRALVLALLCLPSAAGATGFIDYGNDIRARSDSELELHGLLRLRSAALHNLDLDRGLTPSGQLFFPVSLSDPSRQTLYYADMRLRTDFAAYAPGGIVAVKARIDVLDNVSVGDSADGIPGGTLSQRPPAAAFRIKRAWGEVVTPIGYFAAGRMGHHWGLGMLGHGGDCEDCDGGDAADRIAFVTTAFGHLWAAAYDFSATGNVVERKDGIRGVEIEPTAAVRSVAFAILNWRDDFAHRRRRAADRLTFEYGLFYAHRWQRDDIPASYLPIAAPPPIDSAQVMVRGLRAHAVDGWLRFSGRYFRVEAEAAFVYADIEQASLLPGVLLPEGVKSRQLGAALESDFGLIDGWISAGLDAGFASGDPAPGFGAQPPLESISAPQPGDLDGPQGMPPGDNRVDNFRFDSDYRVDRILFREIIGTVTDAIYVRPHARVRLLDFGAARLDASLAAILSFAVEPSSAPGGERPLGLEIDPTLAYSTDDGFGVSLEYAVLFPFAGLDNVEQDLSAKPAQLLRLRATFGF